MPCPKHPGESAGSGEPEGRGRGPCAKMKVCRADKDDLVANRKPPREAA